VGLEAGGGVDGDECADVDVDEGPLVVVFVVVEEDGGMSSAGLGNVLYVEPRDVYLRVRGHRRFGQIMKKATHNAIGRDEAASSDLKKGTQKNSPFIIKLTISHPQPPQESPHVRIIPVDDGVYTFEGGPAWVCHISVGEFGYFVSYRRLVDGFGVSLGYGADRGGDAPP
jgi:hypothetical protein